MNAQTAPSVLEMSPDNLRAAIAKHLQLHLRRKPAKIPTYVDDHYIGLTGSYYAWVDKNEDLAPGARWTNHRVLPDWDADDSAALALCRHIAQTQGYNLVFNYASDGVPFVALEEPLGRGMIGSHYKVTLTDTLALDLTRLALIALQETQ